MRKRLHRLSSLEVQQRLLRQPLTVITKTEFARLFALSDMQTYRVVAQAVQDGVLGRLKPGIYYLIAKPPTAFDVANALYTPSYISLETALSYYRVIPENVYTITSITPKHSRRFTALQREYTYSSLKAQLYFGYQKLVIGGRPIVMAEKEKAFLDYLYLVARGLKKLNERFDLSSLNKDKIASHLPHFYQTLQGRKKQAFHTLISKLPL